MLDGYNLEEHTEKLEEGKDTTYIKTILYNVPKAMCEKILGKAKGAHAIELGLEWKIVPYNQNILTTPIEHLEKTTKRPSKQRKK